MILPMNLMTEGLYLTLTAGGEAILEQTIALDVVNYGNYLLVGVCAEDVSKYDYFSSFGNRLVALEDGDLSYGAGALDALDIVVAEEGWLGAAREDEIACLQDWLEQGRLLVIGSGPGEGQQRMTLNLGLQDQQMVRDIISRISSYETERNGVLADNEELQKHYGSGARACYIGDSMIGPALVNSLSNEAIRLPVKEPAEKEAAWWAPEDASGGETLWMEGGRTIISKYPFGKGNVLLFSIPLSVKASDIYPMFYYRLVQIVQENLTAGYLNQLNIEKYGTNMEGRGYLLGFFRKNGKSIHVAPYLLALVVYIALLLPAAFLLLRRWGKSKYLWGVVPAMSFIMVFLIYGMGRDTRIEKPYCTYLNVIDYTGKIGKGTLSLELSAPTNKGAKIALSGRVAVQLEETVFHAYNPVWDIYVVRPENLWKARECQAAAIWDGSGTIVELDHIAAFSKTAFQVSYEAGQAGEFAADITMGDGRFEGSISNRTGINYKSVYLCGGNAMLEMDNLEDQETEELRSCRQVSFADGGDWYNEETLTKVFGGYPYDGENVILLNLIYEYVFSQEEAGYFVFAVPERDSGQNPLGDIAENPQSQGMEVIIYFLKPEGTRSPEQEEGEKTPILMEAEGTNVEKETGIVAPDGAETGQGDAAN